MVQSECPQCFYSLVWGCGGIYKSLQVWGCGGIYKSLQVWGDLQIPPKSPHPPSLEKQKRFVPLKSSRRERRHHRDEMGDVIALKSSEGCVRVESGADVFAVVCHIAYHARIFGHIQMDQDIGLPDGFEYRPD